MFEPIAELTAFAWPLALTFASAAVVDRVRESRRRTRLNRALHELRRPLQALTLCGTGSARGQVHRAIDALSGLDREINGGDGGRPTRRRVEARSVAEDAVARWREPAVRAGRVVELAWAAGRCVVECDRRALAGALDNLIANALEHGGGPVRIEASRGPGSVRLAVTDHGGGDRVAPAIQLRRSGRDPRRGHGLRVVAEVAAEHGGRFVACRHDAGASAVIELPLVEG